MALLVAQFRSSALSAQSAVVLQKQIELKNACDIAAYNAIRTGGYSGTVNFSCAAGTTTGASRVTAASSNVDTTRVGVAAVAPSTSLTRPPPAPSASAPLPQPAASTAVAPPQGAPSTGVVRPQPAAAADQQRALLALVVNQVEKGEVLVILSGADILVGVGSLEQSGLHGFAGTREPINDQPFVSLASLKPDVTYEFDDRALVLRLTARPELLEASVHTLGSGRPPDLEYRRDPSGFANYALNWRNSSGYDLFTDAGFSARGALLGTTLSFASHQSPMRGLSTATFDQPASLRRIVAGDAFASGGLLGGGLLLGGVSVSREYSVDPYFIRYPTFNLSGAVATPSIVEVYVNDRLVRTQELAPGQFDLTKLPITNGHNDARLVIRDAFGGTREISQSYYLTTEVLAAGLQEYEYSVGFQRKNFGVENWSYGPLAFLGHHRIGLTNVVTVGGRLEAMTDLVSVGPSVTARTPFGELEAAAAVSRERGMGGAAASVAFTYGGRPISFGGSLRVMTENYATSSLKATDDHPTLDGGVFASFQVGPRGSLTVQRRQSRMSLTGSNARTAVIGSARLNSRSDVFMSGAWDHRPEGLDRQFFVGVSIRTIPNAIASVSYERTGAANHLVTEVQQPLPVGTGWGYRFHGESGERDFSTGSVQYQGSYGRYELRRDASSGVQETTVSVAGGLVAIGGGVYASRPIQDGFALVRVPDVPGVRAYASNQEVGRTNGRGNLLVPNLLSYYGNVLNISDQDIPLNHSVGAVRKTIAPTYRGGALAVFPVERVQSSIGTIQLDVGGQLTAPSYGQLKISAGGLQFESPVGEKGEFYLENVPAGRYQAVLDFKEISCTFTLEVPRSDAPIVNLGTVTCAAPPQ